MDISASIGFARKLQCRILRILRPKLKIAVPILANAWGKDPLILARTQWGQTCPSKFSFATCKTKHGHRTAAAQKNAWHLQLKRMRTPTNRTRMGEILVKTFLLRVGSRWTRCHVRRSDKVTRRTNAVGSSRGDCTHLRGQNIKHQGQSVSFEQNNVLLIARYMSSIDDLMSASWFSTSLVEFSLGGV